MEAREAGIEIYRYSKSHLKEAFSHNLQSTTTAGIGIGIMEQA